MISRKKFSVTENFSFFHTVERELSTVGEKFARLDLKHCSTCTFPHSQCGKTRKSLSLKFFSWNQLFSNFFSKNVTFTKFLLKKREREFPQFPNCAFTEKKFRQINSLVICLVKLLLSRNFCPKSVRLKFHNFHTVQCTLWKLQKFTLTKKYFVKSLI